MSKSTRVCLMVVCVALLLVCVASTRAATVPVTAGLQLWLDGADASTMFQDTAGTVPVAASGQQVARWNDKSGNGLNVTEGNAADRPDYVAPIAALNGNSAVFFEGQNGGDVLRATNATGITGNDDRTVITVWANAADTGQNYQHTFHMGDSTGNEAYGISAFRGGSGNQIGNHYWGAGFDSTVDGTAAATIAVATWDGDGGTGVNGLDSWYVNGAFAGASDRGALATGSDQLMIGSRLNPATEGIRGDIAEVLVYDRVLTTTERQAVETYLATKWFTPASQGQKSRYDTVAGFDSDGPTQTPFTAVASGGQTPIIRPDGPTGSFLRITSTAVGNSQPHADFDQNSWIERRDVFGSSPVVLMDFDVRMSNRNPNANDSDADGLGVMLLRTADYGSTGASGVGGFNWEEPGHTSAGGGNLAVGFRIYNANEVSLRYGGIDYNATPSFDLNSDEFHHAQVRVQFGQQGGVDGGFVTMTMQSNSLGMNATQSGSPETLFNNVFIPGLTPYNYRAAFGGRTGGVTNDGDVDNIVIKNGTSAFAFASDFRGRGGELAMVGSAQLRTDVGGNVYNERLTLTDNANSQKGSAWYNVKQPVADGFTTEFQFEFSYSHNGGADGMSFNVHNDPAGLALNVGESGPGANALTISFDSWDNGASDPSISFVRVKTGATIVADHDLLPLDLTDSGIHDVRIDYVPGDLDVWFDDMLIFDSLNVDLGAVGAIDPQGLAWVGFGARTGGASENHEVLNWHFATQTVPEPATMALLGLAACGLGGYVRRRRRV